MAAVNSSSYFLVTGGAGDIGSAVCKLLPTIGMIPVVGFNTNAERAHALAAELGGFAVKIDMNSEESIAAAIQAIDLELGEESLLMGVVLGASPAPDLLQFANLRSEHLLNQFQVNVVGSQQLLSGLIKKFFRKTKTGTVVGILTRATGSETQAPAKGMGAYIIAKAALKSMLSVCAVEYPWLRVKTVSPGFTETKMLDVFDPRYLEVARTTTRFSSPEEVARSIIHEIRP